MPPQRTFKTLATATFYATLTGRMNFNGMRHIGPCIVEVKIEEAIEEGRKFTPSYYVYVNGQHIYGGVADHLNGELVSALSSGSFVNIVQVAPVAPRVYCVCQPYHVTWCPAYGEDNRTNNMYRLADRSMI